MLLKLEQSGCCCWQCCLLELLLGARQRAAQGRAAGSLQQGPYSCRGGNLFTNKGCPLPYFIPFVIIQATFIALALKTNQWSLLLMGTPAWGPALRMHSVLQPLSMLRPWADSCILFNPSYLPSSHSHTLFCFRALEL